MTGSAVTVVGGANSAGQACLFLASRGASVELVIRGSDIRAGMSTYLVERVLAHPSIHLRTESSITALRGGSYLTGVQVSRGDGTVDELESSALFCFIGATPASNWLGDIARDEAGFVLTDSAITGVRLSKFEFDEGRRPLAFETSTAGLFAVGDVRLGSMKRVAAAVGEGASAVASVHRAASLRRGSAPFSASHP